MCLAKTFDPLTFFEDRTFSESFFLRVLSAPKIVLKCCTDTIFGLAVKTLVWIKLRPKYLWIAGRNVRTWRSNSCSSSSVRSFLNNVSSVSSTSIMAANPKLTPVEVEQLIKQVKCVKRVGDIIWFLFYIWYRLRRIYCVFCIFRDILPFISKGGNLFRTMGRTNWEISSAGSKKLFLSKNYVSSSRNYGEKSVRSEKDFFCCLRVWLGWTFFSTWCCVLTWVTKIPLRIIWNVYTSCS